MVTPDEIAKKAIGIYGKYLGSWVRRDEIDFFPHAVRASLTLSKNDKAASIRAVELLRSKSKAVRGWGYTIEERHVAALDGHGKQPKKIWIDTRGDLLRLAGKVNEFKQTEAVVQRLRSELPELETWIVRHVKSLSKYHDRLAGLIAVAKYFLAHPMPGCYAQQLPVDVDTKFVGRNESVLRAWLNEVLPSSAFVAHETRFARRFGLREHEHHRGFLVLDNALHEELELPFDEFSAPAHSLAQLDVSNATVVAVENKTPLTLVPPIERGIVVAGDGASAWMLDQMPWLHANRVVYWGDIDAAGYEILARLREAVPHTESVLMDAATFEAHAGSAQPGKNRDRMDLRALDDRERVMYERCVAENLMLEQEKLSQKYVFEAFAQLQEGKGGALANGRPPH